MSALEKTLNIDKVRAVQWQDDALVLLDQRLLPAREEYLTLTTVLEIADAIRSMVVRGAPAIGVTAAYGVVIAAKECYEISVKDWKELILPKIQHLAESRPTAVNLFWALEQMQSVIKELDVDPIEALLNKAEEIHSEDIAANRKMGEYGAQCIESTEAVLTHCNTGSLATGGFGTALGVIRTAIAQERIQAVYAAETRPWLQGSRLTAWELQQDGIPVTLIADSAAAHLMQTGKIGWVIVGADRIAANGDVANKIGTYNHAVVARHHGVGFMVVAPCSTIDTKTACGDDIIIEQRDNTELLQIAGQPIAPDSSNAYNPVFDVTPAELIDVLVTERGVIQRPDREKIAAFFD